MSGKGERKRGHRRLSSRTICCSRRRPRCWFLKVQRLSARPPLLSLIVRRLGFSMDLTCGTTCWLAGGSVAGKCLIGSMHALLKGIPSWCAYRWGRPFHRNIRLGSCGVRHRRTSAIMVGIALGFRCDWSGSRRRMRRYMQTDPGGVVRRNPFRFLLSLGLGADCHRSHRAAWE